MAATFATPALRLWLRRLLVAGAVLLLLFLAGAFALSRFLDPEELAAWLEPRLEEALARDVEVGRVEVGFLPLGVRLRDVALADPTGLAPELARVASVELRVAVLPLLGRDVRVTRLVVEGLVADLRIGADGSTNFSDLGSRPREGAGGGEARTGGELAEEPGASSPPAPARHPFTLELRGIRLSGARLRFTRDADSLAAEVGELRTRATVRQNAGGPWTLLGASEGVLSLRKGEASPLLDRVPLGLAFDLETDAGLQELRIRTGELRLDRIALALSGRVERLQDPVRRVALALTAEGIPVPELLAALPDSLRGRIPVQAEGRLAADLTVDGEVGQGRVPDVAGKAKLTEGRLSFRGNALAEALTADLTLNPDRTVLALIQATALGGPFSLEGGAALGEGGGMEMSVRATPDLARAGAVVELPEGMTIAGRLETALRVTGPLNDLKGLVLDGEIRALALSLTLPALAVPVGVEEAQVRVEGNRALFRGLPLELGADRMSVSGEIPDVLAFLDPEATPRFQGEVKGARLDLRKLSAKPLPDSTLTYGKVAFAKVGARPVGTRAVEEAARELGLARPDSLPLAGELTVALDTVIDRQGRMEEVRARVDFGPHFLRVPEASFRRYGGEILTSADLSLHAGSSAPFALSLQVRELDAGAFLSETTPLGRFFRGRLTLALDLVGTLDGLLLPDRSGLMGSGSFSLTGGGLASAPLTQSLATFLAMENLREPGIQDWGASLILEDGKVRLGEGTLRGAPGNPKVGGSVGLDGTLDLLSVFDLPTQGLDASALERFGVAGEIARNVAQRPEVVQAVLRIVGSVLSPRIQADPGAAARTLGQAVQEEVRNEVQERIDAQKAAAQQVIQEQQAEAQRKIEGQKEQLQQRATGLLRGLLQRRSPTPPDTVQPDTVRPDTTRPDTLRPDSTRPDTVRPDTVRPDTVHPDTVRPDTTSGGRGWRR